MKVKLPPAFARVENLVHNIRNKALDLSHHGMIEGLEHQHTNSGMIMSVQPHDLQPAILANRLELLLQLRGHPPKQLSGTGRQEAAIGEHGANIIMSRDDPALLIFTVEYRSLLLQAYYGGPGIGKKCRVGEIDVLNIPGVPLNHI